MNNVSQVIRRNLERLTARSVLLLEPAADTLFRDIANGGRVVRHSTGSFGIFRKLQPLGAEVRFEASPARDGAVDTVIVYLPREKEKLNMLLHAAAGLLEPGGRLWLAGGNREGIKSSPRTLARYFARVDKLDSARHCSLFEASETLQHAPFNLDDYVQSTQISHAGKALTMHTLPGVFAHGRLDRGTGLLLEVLESLEIRGRILDFASGSGIIGIASLSSGAVRDAVLLDDSALAIESGRRSLEANGMQAESLPSDGLTELDGRFDWILSNPPFHRGVENDLDISDRFFRDAGTFLNKNGKILVVFNRHLPYSGWLRNSFNHVDCLAQDREFTIILASNNK